MIRCAFTVLTILGLGLVVQKSAGAAALSIAETAGFVECDLFSTCYVFNYSGELSRDGTLGDSLEISISFQANAVKLGAEAYVAVDGYVLKTDRNASVVTLSADMALMGSDGRATTPFAQIFSPADCDATISCGFGSVGGLVPDFSNVTAYGVIVRLFTSGAPIPVRIGLAMTTPLKLAGSGVSTIPIPEASTAILVLLGLAGLGYRRQARG